MKYILALLFIYNVCESASPKGSSQLCSWRRTDSRTFRCTEQVSLKNLDKAKTNTTKIEIYNSKISTIPGRSFARFGATLVILDLHESGIETIDSQAFIGLTKLEKLILWGNELRYVQEDWFKNLYNLRTLDLSFNRIEVIDYLIFSWLPYLENFYFDYNQLRFIDYSRFAYLGNLKRIKFGKNPLSWAFRAHLTWQLENQHVEYTEEWEDWGWMNAGIKDCVETGEGEMPKDNVLDCLVGKLLDFTYEKSPDEIRENVGCHPQAVQLVRCMRPQNYTSSLEKETVRKILQDYVTVLFPMTKSQSLFSTRT